VTPDVGFKVPIGTRAEIVAGFRSVLGQLVASRFEVYDRSAKARDRIQQAFIWPAKAKQVIDLYAQIAGPTRTLSVHQAVSAQGAGQS